MENQKADEQATQQVEEVETTERRRVASKLDAVGWGLFFIWIGIAFLADLGVAVGLLGVGVITLAAQAARKYLNLKLEGFWVVVGLLLLVGGILGLLEAKVDLVPIILIVAGLALLAYAFRGKRPTKE